MPRTRTPGDSKLRRTDWSRATKRMPASFADRPRHDTPVEGRRNDDGLDLIEAAAGAAALAAIAELAAGNEPADILGVREPDVVATQSEDEAAPEEEENPDDED